MRVGEQHQLFCGCFGGPCTSCLQSTPHCGALYSTQHTSAASSPATQIYTLSSLQPGPSCHFPFALRCHVGCPPDLFSFLMPSKLHQFHNLDEIPFQRLLPNFLQAISSCWHSIMLVPQLENLGLYLIPVREILSKPLLNSPQVPVTYLSLRASFLSSRFFGGESSLKKWECLEDFNFILFVFLFVTFHGKRRQGQQFLPRFLIAYFQRGNRNATNSFGTQKNQSVLRLIICFLYI